MSATMLPLMAPVYVPGTEPLPPGVTEDDRAEMAKIAKWNRMANMGMESCPVKCAMSGAAGFGLGAFFSLMSTSFAVDDPLRRTTLAANGLAGTGGDMTTMQSTREFFKQTGKSMYRSGKGFGKVGALYSGIECCIEAYRAKNDLVNPVAAGFAAGAILARNSGPKAAIGGGVAFAAFSGAIDIFRRETPDDD
ncbi:related to Tim22, mitochondrial import inner membrane translocase subunit [Sporisorium reilianum SRZ2]|uniref:Mitochondrial import inner membrane translocase subunit TIM22 n=1 Tax=Sporisorium reilianum (strain SRZ2) TaxID=999809 RepID=E7A0D5_SPORE|nr:related to Tim22, mitochondrial import inner membrane translocase subunit [Sporisorium reilianum SRZ2]